VSSSAVRTVVTQTVAAADRGKPVIDANGERIATVQRIDDGTVLVDPVPEIGPATTRALGWTDDHDDLVPLRPQSIDTVTDGTVRLESNL